MKVKGSEAHIRCCVCSYGGLVWFGSKKKNKKNKKRVFEIMRGMPRSTSVTKCELVFSGC